MPVTGTLGALTYARVALSPNLEYWALKNNNASAPTKLLIENATQSIYVSSKIYGINVVKIAGYINPSMNFNYDYQPLSNTGFGLNKTAIAFGAVTNTILGVTQTRNAYTPAYPYYTVFPSAIQILDSTNGGTLDNHWKWPNYVPPTASNRSFSYYDDIIVDSTGQIYIIDRETETNLPQYTIWLSRYLGYSLNGGATLYGISTSAGSTSSGIRLQLSSVENPIVYLQIGTKVRIYENSKTAGSAPYYPLTNIYNSELALSTSTLTGTDMIVDTSDNRMLTLNISNDGYLVKLSSTQTITWQQKVTNTKLYSVAFDSSNNVYAVGITSTNKLWIGKWNSSGTLQWQNELSSTVSFSTNCYIKIDNFDELIIASFFGQQVMFRLPNDGSIPGSGNYNFSDNTTPLTYTISSQTINTSSITISSPGSTGTTAPLKTFNYDYSNIIAQSSQYYRAYIGA